jgi:hypothetical protein
MKKFGAWVLIFGGAVALHAQAQPRPQNARQALIEMFFSKTPGTFEKHLPDALRAALRKAGGSDSVSMLQGFSALSGQLTASGQQLQTFEAGPTLASAEDPRTHSKLEITVERDDLQGEEDDIDVSFHLSKDGQEQNSFLTPKLTFVMKQEAEVWKLNELALTMRMALADPKFLEEIAKSMKQNKAASQPPAVAAIRNNNTAEVTYAATYPARGYTCLLSDLDGFGAGGTNEHQAMLIDSGLASGKKAGYIFSLNGCTGVPAKHYTISAVPVDPSAHLRAYCSDESGVIRYSSDGKAANCLGSGMPIQ